MNKNKRQAPIQLQVALVPVCKMVIRFGLHFHEFTRNLQKAYIKAAEEILIESKVNPNLQAVAIKTGMDRRTISEHKNNEDKSYTNPLNKMDMIIVQLQRFSASSKDQKIKLINLKEIINSIYARHIRSGAIINELVSNKIIKQVDVNTYKLNLTLQQQLTQISEMANDVDYTAKRLFQTYYKNMFENKKTDDFKPLQSTCHSTKVASRHHNMVNGLIKDELIKAKNKINQIIKKHESNVPEDTYPELGIIQFQFNSDKQ
jgi:hypothetical protein